MRIMTGRTLPLPDEYSVEPSSLLARADASLG